MAATERCASPAPTLNSSTSTGVIRLSVLYTATLSLARLRSTRAACAAYASDSGSSCLNLKAANDRAHGCDASWCSYRPVSMVEEIPSTCFPAHLAMEKGGKATRLPALSACMVRDMHASCSNSTASAPSGSSSIAPLFTKLAAIATQPSEGQEDPG